jgi:hypothetical protein
MSFFILDRPVFSTGVPPVQDVSYGLLCVFVVDDCSQNEYVSDCGRDVVVNHRMVAEHHSCRIILVEVKMIFILTDSAGCTT